MSSPARSAARRALGQAERGNLPAAWRLLHPHLNTLQTDPEFAWAWLVVANAAEVGWRHRRRIAALIETFSSDTELAELGAETLLNAIDSRPHDLDPRSDDDPARLALAAIDAALAAASSPGLLLWRGMALRLLGPARAAEAVTALAAAVARQPQEPTWRYELALALKAAGRFREAVTALERSGREDPEAKEDEGYWWNLAICATGAGLGPLAQQAWAELGMNDGAFGPDGLPAVPLLADLQVRVRLGPGEHVRVSARPQSPCHGTLLAAAGDLPQGATALWDVTPVEPVEPGEMPCLPLLARL
ncbi:MAG: tetratricopeptide (TPR) repeat protein [Myxococcota bacterium]|jgi:tetratricopeptide (TPR) repeat protein